MGRAYISAAKEDPILKVFNFVVTVCKNQSKFQNNLLIGLHSKTDGFLHTDTAKYVSFKFGSSLKVSNSQKHFF